MASISCQLLLLLVVTTTLIGQILTQDATVSFTVREERPIRTYIGSVALKSELFTSFSNDRFASLEFQILIPHSGKKYVGMFEIETDTGMLWTKKVIDREEYIDCIQSCKVDFNVAVYEKEILEPINIIKVIVDITDYNDNAPQFFPAIQELVISESTLAESVLLRSSAVDLDLGNGNSVQTYSMFPTTEVFEIETLDSEEKEFIVRLKTALDYETVSFYQIVILAIDGGSPQLTGTLSVNIKVTDFNDNPPKFEKELYEFDIEENIPVNSTILVLSAQDEDEGENARVAYKFSGRVSDKITALFNIKEHTGELTVASPIDYETDKQFEFAVHAVDHGSQAKTATANIVIHVKDLNDNFPQINLNQRPGGTVLSELAALNSFVAHVEITDDDEGKNGEVTCSILDDHFRLEKFGAGNNYEIVLNKLLDHDTQASHNVSIVCQDSGNLPKQSFTNFIVHVEDSNDNAPVFKQELYSVLIIENNPVGVSIIDVSATDKDSGSFGQVSYSLHSHLDGLFIINSFTGVITANKSLDRETQGDQSIFRVLAKDGGNPPLTSTGTVVINILDLNDNDPIFDKNPLVLNVSENLPRDTLVGNISVHDPDKDTNGTFYLTFPTQSNVTDYFYFSNSGKIMTNKKLDRESLDLHEFYVSATDMGGRSSSTLVTIHVMDQNDNIPEIIYPINSMQFLPYSSPSGTLAAQVLVDDRDISINALLQFEMEQDNSTYKFILDEFSGKLILNSTINIRDIGQVFHFVIKVTDNGSPPLSAWATVNIEITNSAPVVEKYTEAEVQSNFWIMIAIVAVTIVLSMIMVAIILKICWVNRKKAGSRSSSKIILESGEINPKLINSSSSSAASTSSKDSNANEKIKVTDLYPASDDGFQHNDTGFQSSPDETGSMLNTTMSSVDKHIEDRLYMEKVKELSYNAQKRTDETNSDNSGEIGTRDSGQGGSDVDLNSLTELPVLDIPDAGSYSDDTSTPSHKTYLTGNFDDRIHDNSNQGNLMYSGTDGSSCSNQSTVEFPNHQKTLGSYQVPPLKTAERKELAKLKKGQKRVMFSDDLENSHSSGRSSTMSTLSYSDINNLVKNAGLTRQLNRLYSHDPTNRVNGLRDSAPLRRSVDDLTVHGRHDNTFRQLPSNQNRFSSSGQIMGNTNQNLHRNLDQNGWQNANQNFDSGRSDFIFSVASDYQRSSSSRENDSTTTSGSYTLTLDEMPLSPTDNVFPSDLYV